jgi:cell fate regulator YaaT (PSP1 superfamily)
MSFAVGVKFGPESFPKFFKPADLALEENDFCVVLDEEKGCERVGYVACLEGRCAFHVEHLKPIVRRASEAEIDQWHRACRRQREALATARGKVVDHGLPMKLISVSFNDEQNVVLFYFTADHRIDFRELVRDLAGVFKARIELWQIGSRQGAAQKEGFGQCGRHMCCASWMNAFPPISIRQAREQDINQSPPKLSGLCGRLRCCLRFEHDTYCKLRKQAPPVGASVKDAQEREGVVVDRNLITAMALVQFEKSKVEWLAFDGLAILNAGPAGSKESELAAATEEEDVPISEYDEGS